jgi:sugar phosphate isomerase/epimerase
MKRKEVTDDGSIRPIRGPLQEGLHMIHTSRRAFLSQSAVLSAGLFSLGRGVATASATTEPDIKFPTEARDRLAVASWPFRAFIEAPTNRWARDPKSPGIDLKEFGAMVVKRFGLHNIEPLDQHFRSTDRTYVLELREATERAGARVVDVPVDIRASYYDPNPSQRGKAVEQSKQWIDIAAALGSPSVRLHIAGAGKEKPDAGRTVESLKQVADYAAGKNIIANLENDDNFTEDPFFIVQVLEKLNNPYVRALPDFCNSMLTHDAEFNFRGLRALFKHAYNIAHVKDSEVGGKGKVYAVDVPKCFEIAKASGYRGFYSMELEGAGEPYAGTQKLIDLSLKYLA